MAPPRKFVDEVRSVVAAALRVAQADPSEVDDYLRQGVTASLASDHEGARAIFEALLPPENGRISFRVLMTGEAVIVDECLLGPVVPSYAGLRNACRCAQSGLSLADRLFPSIFAEVRLPVKLRSAGLLTRLISQE